MRSRRDEDLGLGSKHFSKVTKHCRKLLNTFGLLAVFYGNLLRKFFLEHNTFQVELNTFEI